MHPRIPEVLASTWRTSLATPITAACVLACIRRAPGRHPARGRYDRSRRGIRPAASAVGFSLDLKGHRVAGSPDAFAAVRFPCRAGRISRRRCATAASRTIANRCVLTGMSTKAMNSNVPATGSAAWLTATCAGSQRGPDRSDSLFGKAKMHSKRNRAWPKRGRGGHPVG